jgi:hypothetical protein
LTGLIRGRHHAGCGSVHLVVRRCVQHRVPDRAADFIGG